MSSDSSGAVSDSESDGELDGKSDGELDDHHSESDSDFARRYARLVEINTITVRGALPRSVISGGFREYLHCPHSISGKSMNALVRYPELVAKELLVTVDASDVQCHIVRILDLTRFGPLVQMVKAGRLVPCFPPADGNDLYARFSVYQEGSDIVRPAALFCFERFCYADQVWKPATLSEIRWCKRCSRWSHLPCLLRWKWSLNLKDYEKEIRETQQTHLLYLLSDRPRRDQPARLAIEFGVESAIDEDVEDKREAVPWPHTTWEELASLPIRRRTRPGRTPQTLETVILFAMAKCGEDHGSDVVPSPREWIKEAGGPHAGVRATKLLVNKELRKLRRPQGIRRFLCACCDVGYV
ncbi:hypothetical protein K523DRAFT_257636 [Schizophyllum commune Tattone D]|nr:hypothetical protein K523DRAFT_257636 [Schizophyllum commune Tattone D]